MEKLHIIFGGASVEHDVSIITALQTYNALKDKYDIVLIYCSRDNRFFLSTMTTTNDYIDKDDIIKKSAQVAIFDKGLYKVKKNKLKYIGEINRVVNCCHGGIGEDGRLAALLDCNNIVSTSAGSVASGVCMNKEYSKLIAQSLNIPIVDYVVVDSCCDLQNKVADLGENLIVKPCSLGSSIGVLKSNLRQVKDDVDVVLHLDNRVLIEKEISPLVEYNCAVIRDGDNILLSQIEQPVNKSDILSFEDKYIATERTRIIPAEIPKEREEQIYEYSKKIYQHLNLNGVVRIDYLYSKEEDKVYFNEINTIPGSLAYYLFEGLGISYIKLMEILIRNAKTSTLQPYFSSNILTNLKEIGK